MIFKDAFCIIHGQEWNFLEVLLCPFDFKIAMNPFDIFTQLMPAHDYHCPFFLVQNKSLSNSVYSLYVYHTHFSRKSLYHMKRNLVYKWEVWILRTEWMGQISVEFKDRLPYTQKGGGVELFLNVSARNISVQFKQILVSHQFVKRVQI